MASNNGYSAISLLFLRKQFDQGVPIVLFDVEKDFNETLYQYAKRINPLYVELVDNAIKNTDLPVVTSDVPVTFKIKPDTPVIVIDSYGPLEKSNGKDGG